MSRIQELLTKFESAAKNPRAQLDGYLGKGKKAIGCLPYYVPEELVHAAGMVPMGLWGSKGTINAAKEYFAPFYCTIVQMGLEMALTGKIKGLSAAIVPSICDALRPFSQNFRVTEDKTGIPMIFIAHPQNRKPEYGIKYIMVQFGNVKKELEKIAGTPISDDSLRASIKVYNSSRAARREFVKLAGKHPEAVTPAMRSAVLKSAFFMLKEEHTALLNQLNSELSALPASNWKGSKILTSGILADNPSLLSILEEQKFAITADDVAHESRAIRVDADETGDPMLALAKQFSGQDDDPLLYDPNIDQRPGHVVRLAKESGAQGVVMLQMQFCDPEELEYPSLKKALNDAGIPSILIGYDQTMKDFAQARTQLQAFSDLL